MNDTAQRLQDNALDHFAKGQAAYMAPDHLAWRARAGLRAGQWSVVREAIAAMPAEQQQEPAWVYWRARSLEALPELDPIAAKAQALALYESLASPRSFYGQLALEALGRRVAAPAPPPPPVGRRTPGRSLARWASTRTASTAAARPTT